MCTETERAIRIWNHIRSEEDMKKYCEAKKDAQRVVYMAMDQKAREALEKVDLCRDGRELFRIAKQRVSRNPSSYRGIKLLEHAFKLHKKVLDGRLYEVVDINKIQYGFMPGYC